MEADVVWAITQPPARLAKLYPVHAKTAAGAGDHHPVSRRNVAYCANGVQHRADGTGRDRRRIECDVIGHGHDIVRIDNHELGKSAVQPCIAEKHLLGTERFASTATVATMPADMLALRGGDTIANGEVIDRHAYSAYCSGDLVPWHAWQPDAVAQQPRAYRNVMRADAAERDPNDDLVRPWRGFAQRLTAQGGCDGSGVAKNHGAHRHVLQDRDRIDGTAGAANDWQRGGNKQELVTTGGRKFVQQQSFQQRYAEVTDEALMHRKHHALREWDDLDREVVSPQSRDLTFCQPQRSIDVQAGFAVE